MRSVLASAPHPDPANRFNSEFLAQSCKVVTICERSVQLDPKICWDWTERQGLVGVIDLELTLGLSVGQVKGRRHRFCMAASLRNNF